MTDTVLKPPPLDRRYTVAWVVLFLAALVVELIAPRSWYWGALFGLGVVLELVAVFRPALGDTLSEQIWAWETNGAAWLWARSLAVAGIALWIAFRFYEFGPGGGVARAALAGGFCGWMLLHLLFRGRWG
ncbi:MAG: hypothetical protein AB7G12_17490 [Thermoanaerobaculia bacterium]